MAVDKEANSLSRVYSYYSKFNLRLFYVWPALARYLSILFLNIYTLWTLKPDTSGFVHSLHCNHQMAAQNERMPVPVGDGCSQYIYRHFAAIFTKFDRGKVFLRLF